MPLTLLNNKKNQVENEKIKKDLGPKLKHFFLLQRQFSKFNVHLKQKLQKCS